MGKIFAYSSSEKMAVAKLYKTLAKLNKKKLTLGRRNKQKHPQENYADDQIKNVLHHLSSRKKNKKQWDSTSQQWDFTSSEEIKAASAAIDVE